MGPGLRLPAEGVDGNGAVVEPGGRAALAGVGHRVEPPPHLHREMRSVEFTRAQQQAAAGSRVVTEARQRVLLLPHGQREPGRLLRAQLGLYERAGIRQRGREIGGQRVESVLHSVARQRPLAHRQGQPTVVDQHLDGVARRGAGRPRHRGRESHCRDHAQKHAG